MGSSILGSQAIRNAVDPNHPQLRIPLFIIGGVISFIMILLLVRIMIRIRYEVGT